MVRFERHGPDLGRGIERVAHAQRPGAERRNASDEAMRRCCRCTRIREPAIQICPLLLKTLTSEPSTARFEIGIIENDVGGLAAQFEVHRREVCWPPTAMTWRAVVPPPVKAMRSISAAEPASAAPVTAPLPVDNVDGAGRQAGLFHERHQCAEWRAA